LETRGCDPAVAGGSVSGTTGRAVTAGVSTRTGDPGRSAGITPAPSVRMPNVATAPTNISPLVGPKPSRLISEAMLVMES
jgi:hypothetical protein